uniref:Uncharacterized protein n=1 Tax=Vespula pensylvanica TaxID=30213 RepID=A0A834K957_VESPE|nr:hypothetical protein H0235_015541 [Vespula pensylvanica]
MLAVHKTNVHRSCLVRRRSIDRQLICLVHDEDDDDDDDDDDETMPFFNNVTQVVRDGDSDRNDGGGVSMQVTTQPNDYSNVTKDRWGTNFTLWSGWLAGWLAGRVHMPALPPVARKGPYVVPGNAAAINRDLGTSSS